MSENLLDDFLKDKSQNFSSPIPQGAWEKVVSKNTFDNFAKDKLENFESVVPSDLFDKILAKNTFEHFAKDKLDNFESPVPENTFDKILAKTSFDNYVKESLVDYESKVPAGLWDKLIAERETDILFKTRLTDYISDVPANLWQRIVGSGFIRTEGNWFARNAAVLIAACLIGLMITTYAVLQNNKQKNAIENSNVSTQGTEKQNSSSSTQQSSSENNLNGGNNNNIPPTDQSNNIQGSGEQHNQNTFIPLVARSSSSQQQLQYSDFNNNQTVNTQTVIVENTDEEKETSRNILPSELYSLNNFKSLNNLNNQYKLSKGLSPEIIPCPNEKPIDWFVEPYISPDYSNKVVTNNGGLSTAYMQLKDSAESMRVGFTAGIRLSKRIGNHLLMKGGIQYSQINEQLALRTENERKTTTVIISRTIVRPQGDTTISDTTSVTEVGYRVTKNMNRYKNIEIPLTVGYEFGDPKDKWKIAVNGGVALNIASWYSGYTLDTSLTVVPVDKSTGTYTKSSVGLSILGSVSVIRNIDERTDAFVEPYFKYGLTGTNSTAGFTQKFNTFGVQAGIRVKLNYVKHHY